MWYRPHNALGGTDQFKEKCIVFLFVCLRPLPIKPYLAFHVVFGACACYVNVLLSFGQHALCVPVSSHVCVFVLQEFTFVWFYEVWDLVISGDISLVLTTVYNNMHIQSCNVITTKSAISKSQLLVTWQSKTTKASIFFLQSLAK